MVGNERKANNEHQQLAKTSHRKGPLNSTSCLCCLILNQLTNAFLSSICSICLYKISNHNFWATFSDKNLEKYMEAIIPTEITLEKNKLKHIAFKISTNLCPYSCSINYPASIYLKLL